MRRQFLIGGTATLATLILRPARAAHPRRINLTHARTGARFSGIWHTGLEPDPVAMAELSAVLADGGANPPKPFDAKAIEILWEVAERTRLGSELTVISGYRTPAVNRAAHGAGDSQHLRASALDVDVSPGRLPAVAEAAIKMARGGVGIYPRRHFVHLDSGPVRRWTEQTARIAAASAPKAEDPIGRIASAWQAAQAR